MKNEVQKQETELVIFQQITPLQIFAENKADDFLAGVEKEVDEFKKTRDVSTPKGRAEIKSFSYKISQTKAPVDKAGLNLTEEARDRINKVNDERKRVKEKLQSFQDDVRQPLTDFENKEKKRIEDFQDRIKDMESFKNYTILSTDGANRAIDDLGKIYKSCPDWEEFENKAKKVCSDVNIMLCVKRELLKDEEAKEAEFQRLKKVVEERDKKEREEKIIRETEENIKRVEREKAERIAREEEEKRFRLEAEKKAAEQAKINAEIRVKEAAKIARFEREQAKRDAEKEKERAVEQEREKFRLEEEAKIEAAKDREANLKHRHKIHTEAKNDLINQVMNHKGVGILTEEQARSVVVAISGDLIANISIKY